MVSLASDGPGDRPAIRPMLLSSDDEGARVSLVPEGALLLAGDAVSIAVSVGPGARLEIIEPAGTVAYAMEGACASWDVSIELAAGASLVWAGEPFVVAEGATVDRRTRVALGPGALLALREMLVLGRHGERAGTLRQDLSVTGSCGAPVLEERLDVGPGSSRLLLGNARAIGTVLLVGDRLPATHEGTRLDLEADGTMVRMLAADAHTAALRATWAAARSVRP